MDKTVLAVEIMEWWAKYKVRPLQEVQKPKFVEIAEEILKEKQPIVMKS